MSDDAVTVIDLVTACRRIARFVENLDDAQFLADEVRHWAVVSQLIIIGEAVGRLSQEFTAGRSHIPWRQIAGTRNRLIHEYDKINWSIVWTTASRDVPVLAAELEPLVPADSSEDDATS